MPKIRLKNVGTCVVIETSSSRGLAGRMTLTVVAVELVNPFLVAALSAVDVAVVKLPGM
jgi:predicted component of type VI protein secretion system